jgi:hypothetical protein
MYIIEMECFEMFKAMRIYYSSIFNNLKSNKKILHAISCMLIYAILIFTVAFNVNYIGLKLTLLTIVLLTALFLLGVVPFISWYIVYYKDK